MGHGSNGRSTYTPISRQTTVGLELELRVGFGLALASCFSGNTPFANYCSFSSSCANPPRRQDDGGRLSDVENVHEFIRRGGEIGTALLFIT